MGFSSASSSSSSKKASFIVLFLFWFPAATFLQAKKTYTYTFDQSHPFQDLSLQNADIDHNAIQVTPDTGTQDFNNFPIKNMSGRMFIDKPFKLWKGKGRIFPGNSTDYKQREIASFNSTFRVNIYPLNGSAGEGLTFLVASTMELPGNSSGQFLGLTNASTDGNTTNRVVAVELDTNKQDFDPDGNHVGIDVNGVRSVKVASLTHRGMVLAPNSTAARFYNVWVQYDGASKVMEVFIGEQETKDGGDSPPKPESPVLRADLDLRDHLSQESYFGFSASTGTKYVLNCVLRWRFSIDYFPENQESRRKIVATGVGVTAAVLAAVAAAAYWVRKRRNLRSQSAILGALKSLPGTPREFEFKDLKKATENFGEKNKLGSGGYGVVYKGCLAVEKMEVAVKLFSRENMKGEDDFLAELTIINRLRHKHLVKLLGWCHKYGKLLLVYEYMPHGSLDQHIFSSPPEKDPLSWELRCKILCGVASALHYLHDEFEQRVVHRDLKASNIMLDSHFNARLGDFGLARALDNEKTSYAEAEGVLGTMGYVAPECFHTGKATRESDVYAFGAVILEVLCGQRPGAKIGGFNILVDWVWYLHRDGRIREALDPRLGDDYVEDQAERLLLLGLACSHPAASERPRTSDVLQIIQGSIPTPNVPPFKPSFVWPSMVPFDMDSLEADLASSTTTSQFNSGWTPQSISDDRNNASTSGRLKSLV